MAQIMCGKCRVGAEAVTDTDGKKEAVCPSCGQRDKVEDALRVAGEQAADAAARQLQSGIADSVRGNKFMKFEGKPLPRRTFKWHAV